MKITAIVPIKTRSTRLVNKNFLDFCGQPLYQIILDKLQRIGVIDKIIINTDSDIIAADCTQRYSKVVIIDRPDFLKGDHITMNSIIDYDLAQTSEMHFLQTHCTNPILTETTIENAIETYFNNLSEFDSLFSVDAIQKRGFLKNGDPINHSNSILLPTQKLDPIYIENSNLFLFSRESFYNSGKSRIGKNAFLYPMNSLESIDMDYEQDFILAKLIYENQLHLTETSAKMPLY